MFSLDSINNTLIKVEGTIRKVPISIKNINDRISNIADGNKLTTKNISTVKFDSKYCTPIPTEFIGWNYFIVRTDIDGYGSASGNMTLKRNGLTMTSGKKVQFDLLDNGKKIYNNGNGVITTDIPATVLFYSGVIKSLLNLSNIDMKTLNDKVNSLNSGSMWTIRTIKATSNNVIPIPTQFQNWDFIVLECLINSFSGGGSNMYLQKNYVEMRGGSPKMRFNKNGTNIIKDGSGTVPSGTTATILFFKGINI